MNIKETKIYKEYNNLINEELFTLANIALFASGMFIAKMISNSNNKPSLIDYIAGFIAWGSREYDSNKGIDFRDIKKVAYERLDKNNYAFENLNEDIVNMDKMRKNTIKSLFTYSKQKFIGFMGHFIVWAINKFEILNRDDIEIIEKKVIQFKKQLDNK